jgi:hypothetical protein
MHGSGEQELEADPEVGEIVLLHVPGRSHPIQATVTGVTRNESRPPSLNLRILVPGMGATNLVHIEHVSLGHPFGGWERPRGTGT